MDRGSRWRVNSGHPPYLHNNPVRAGLVSEARESDWTSHRQFLDEGPRLPWLAVGDALTGATWTERTPASGPAARHGRAMAYDELRGRVVLVGGTLAGGGSAPPARDVWEWDGTRWVPLLVDEDLAVRESASLAFDAARGQLVVRGTPGGADDRYTAILRWAPDTPMEWCRYGHDTDGDSLVGCDDPDCWGYCEPWCLPGTSCDPALASCGDGTCQSLENGRLCPADCALPAALCGDLRCDPTETACPGDCSP